MSTRNLLYTPFFLLRKGVHSIEERALHKCRGLGLPVIAALTLSVTVSFTLALVTIEHLTGGQVFRRNIERFHDIALPRPCRPQCKNITGGFTSQLGQAVCSGDLAEAVTSAVPAHDFRIGNSKGGGEALSNRLCIIAATIRCSGRRYSGNTCCRGSR